MDSCFKFESLVNKKNILFAVLNWGLGHATRSWELINNLVNEGHKVILASDGVAKEFLTEEFPDLVVCEIPSYNAKYSHKGNIFPAIKNGLKTQLAVKKEQRWLQQFLKRQAIDLIISDNRYGIYCSDIKSIIITHQLNIKVPFFGNLINAQNHFWLSRFNEIWVPDNNGKLSGELSQPIPKKIAGKVKEIGWLSRFKNIEKSSEDIILAIVSGPEPQKTILTTKLTSILSKLDYDSILYTGSPGKQKNEKVGRLIIKNHDSTSDFSKNIKRAKVVIGRSGYSSIMDYFVMHKNMILIPTPGQYEQLYLARNLNINKKVTLIKQEDVNFDSLKKELIKYGV